MEIKGRRKFRNKVMAIFILIAILPLLIITVSSLIIVIKTRQQNITELQNLAVDNANEKINAFFDEKMELLNLVLDTSGDLSTMSPEIRVQVINTFGYLVDNIRASAKDIVEISFTDRAGQEIVKRTDNGVAILRNISAEPQFKAANFGQEYFGPIEFREQGPVMVLASQIENKERAIIGVISATVNLTPISELIGQIRLGDTGYVYVIDRDGRLVSQYGENQALAGDSLAGRPSVAAVLKSKPNTGLTGFNTYRDEQGVDLVFAGRPMRSLDWRILSEWPEDDAFSVIDSILYLSLGIAGATLLLVILISLFLVRQIVKPINSLYHAAKHISDGDYGYRVRLKTKDEFEVLGDKFNEMIKALAENRKLRDEFVFIAAHELRTPVTAIRGYLSMVLENTFGDVPEEIRRNLMIVSQSNDRLVQLVQDLLEVARSEAGKMKIEITEIPMSENVTTVINELKSLSDQKGITVSYERPEPDINVKADSYKLKEVLTNLAGNAIKYTAGNGEINITHEKKDNTLVTHIRDHGIGMTPEEVEKLFGKFYRAQNDDTKSIEGTGLGLFICKEIVERMGGQIWVTSEKGKGSTFSFSLSLA